MQSRPDRVFRMYRLAILVGEIDRVRQVLQGSTIVSKVQLRVGILPGFHLQLKVSPVKLTNCVLDYATVHAMLLMAKEKMGSKKQIIESMILCDVKQHHDATARSPAISI